LLFLFSKSFIFLQLLSELKHIKKKPDYEMDMLSKTRREVVINSDSKQSGVFIKKNLTQKYQTK